MKRPISTFFRGLLVGLIIASIPATILVLDARARQADAEEKVGYLVIENLLQNARLHRQLEEAIKKKGKQ
jgi:hypothetical protein